MRARRAPDPATSAMIQTVSGQTPGVPQGAKIVRVPGSREAVAPLHYNPVRPWGESCPTCGASWELRRAPGTLPCIASSCHAWPQWRQMTGGIKREHRAGAWYRAPHSAEEALWPLMHDSAAAGVTPGLGRGPSDFERMQRRHWGAASMSALLHSLAAASAWRQPAIRLPGQTVRAFNKRVEVSAAWDPLPASAHLG